MMCFRQEWATLSSKGTRACASFFARNCTCVPSSPSAGVLFARLAAVSLTNKPLASPPSLHRTHNQLKTNSTPKQKNEAMWAAKEKMGDDSLDFVAVPEASAVSPESPPKVHPRRSSVARAINFLRGGAGGARGDGNSTGGVSGRADEHDDGCANSHAAAEAARASVAGANSQSSTSIEDGTDACAELEEGTCGRRRCLGLQGVGGMSGAALGVVQVGSCGGVTATDLAAPAMGREPGPTTPPGACRVLEDVNRGGRRDRDTGESILPARRFSLEKVFPPPPGSSSS